ncbi:MAG TPA: M4 family metallopeptidase [Bacteroidales bacterium]|nr:M4 family metallopeptidase [Bacteroidales bacterium]
MNRIFSTITLILVSLFVFGGNGQTYTGQDAQSRIPGAAKIFVSSDNDVYNHIWLAAGENIPITSATYWLKTNLSMSPAYEYHPAHEPIQVRGEYHQRYYLHYNGARVHDGMVIIHGEKGRLTSVNGNLYNRISTLNEPRISESLGLEKALSSINAVQYRWELASEEQHLKWETGDESATYYPKGELILLPSNVEDLQGHIYAWKFKVYCTVPLAIKEVMINAADGSVLRMIDLIQTVDVQGTAVTKYSGVRTITTDSTGTTYRLQETGRGNGIETYNLQNGTNYNNAVDFTDADNYWNNFNAQKDEIATDAHWGAEMTYDYFWLEHGRNSIDGNGFKLRSYVHYSNNYANAFWDGYRMTYGDGSGSMGPLTALDIIAHEISHGLTSFTADLDYAYESGALNESFSDIFGAAVEFYAKPTAANWTIGENIGVIIRSMSNPNAYGDPDTYLGTNWYIGSGDNGGVHTNSGVLNYWFYLLTVGGIGTNDLGNAFNVSGIGIDKAGEIAFRMLTVYLTNTSQYIDARFYAILSAVDLYGACSPEVAAVTNAMYAIGVGPAYYNGVLSQFVAADTVFCSLPASVSFDNLTVNGMNFSWDFGDGNSSVLRNPVHTYTQPGTYSVQLMADGGACGADTIVKHAYITIATPPPPYASGLGNCGPGAVVLNAQASDTIRWYDAPTGGNLLHVGPTYTTPWLNQSASYFVANSQETPPVYGGKPDNTGPGAYFDANARHYLIFNATAPVHLKSVKVYAGSAGNRTIELRSSNGTILQSVSVGIPSGQSRVDLNFNIPAGTNLQLSGPVYPDLYRNSGGTAYPYQVGPNVSIIKSSASTNPTGYYYYFYDWELQDAPCVSQRVEVIASIDADEPVADYSFTQSGDLAQFTNLTQNGNVFHWDFGDGNTSNQVSPSHLYATTGTYDVKLVSFNGCGSDSITYQVPVIITGTNPLVANDMEIKVWPNPAKDMLYVSFPPAWMIHPVSYRISDILGRPVETGVISQGVDRPLELSVSQWNSGLYVIETWIPSARQTRKVMVID